MPSLTMSMTFNDANILQEAPFCCSNHDPIIYNARGKKSRVTSSSKKEETVMPLPPPPPLRPRLSSSVNMRKVKSLDFTSLCNMNQMDDCHKTKASKFSSSPPPKGSLQRSLSFGRLLPTTADALLLNVGDSPSLLPTTTDSTTMKTMVQHCSPWTLVSVILLLCMTINFCVGSIGTGTASSVGGEASSRIPSHSSLGSAAISSITETLSPILPFTGGVDLRREFLESSERADQSWYDAASSVMAQVRDAFATTSSSGDGTTSSSTAASVLQIPRAGDAGVAIKVPPSSKNNKSHRSSKTLYPSTISDSKCFYPVAKIAEFTLSDLTELFEYSMTQHLPTFDKSKFLNKASDKIKPVIDAMDKAVLQSRGGDASISTRTSSSDTTSSEEMAGNVDALYFCAILRLFAEWRIVRQVPEGYKGYAVGMNLGHKDIVQNLHKMEAGVHHYLQHQTEELLLDTVTSPTLRDLLQHEIDAQVHSKLPRLKEKSAAMGLLWVRRQLHYQTCVFGNILQVPSSQFPNSNAAVSHAYLQVYGNYHGWAVQKIFNYSFQAAPDVTEIYKYMNPSLLERVTEKSKRIVVNDQEEEEDAVSSTQDDATTSNDKNKNPLERLIHHIGGEFDKLGKELGKFGRHVGGEFDKLIDGIVRVFDQDSSTSTSKRREAAANQMRGGGGADSSSAIAAREAFVVEQMAQDAHQRISTYLQQVEPLLQDLASLFGDLNMDDPTKV